MKTDIELQRDVIDELRWDPSLKEKEIAVAASDGVITLSGFVPSYPEKWAAERAVERVFGVKAVANDIEVKLPGDRTRPDPELAHKVVEALEWDVQVPDDKIKAAVTNGWVTLEGEVAWAFQRDAALRAVRNIAGVRGVTNKLTLVPPAVSSYDVAVKIKDALRRRAERDAAGITIETKDNVVTLKGKVPTFAERRAAEGAAWSAPGVKEVHDEIVVSI